MSEYVSNTGQGSPAFDESMGKVLVSLGRETFETLYNATHSEAAEALYQIRQQPGQENAPLPDYIKRDLDQKNQEYAKQWESVSPGEFMMIYGPLHSPEAEKLYQIYNRDALVGANDPSINDYGTERLQAMINAQNVGDLGLSEEEAKQKEQFEKFQDLIEHFEEIEKKAEERRLQKWNEDFHKFGDMSLSGEDLQKLMDFLKDPTNRAKIEQRMRDQNIDEKTIKQGSQEMDEYIRLMEAEKKRDLTKAEQERLKQIQESEAFKKYAQSTAESAQNIGISLPSMKKESVQNLSQNYKKESKNREFQIHAELAKTSRLSVTDLDNGFARETGAQSAKTREESAAGISAPQEVATKKSWNVVDMQQAFQDNNKTLEVSAQKATPSNLELIQENKNQLVEPKDKPPVPTNQIAAAAPSTAGFSL